VHKILKMLEGGDRRSIGRSNEVVTQVLQQPPWFEVLISGIALADPLLRMRCADAAEKISVLHPEYLQTHKRTLIEDYSRIEQKEVRWHVTAMLSRLKLTKKEQQRVVAILLDYTNDRSSIVKTLAMQALADLALRDTTLLPVVQQHIGELTVTGTPAMQARGRMLLKRLNRQNQTVQKLEDLPNIGKSIAADLRAIGIQSPTQLAKCDPLATYLALAKKMGQRHDPCMLYTLMAARHFLESGVSLPWWQFTEQGKKLLAARTKPIPDGRTYQKGDESAPIAPVLPN